MRVLSALLTPTIAVVTAYIAWQQYQTNRRQHRLALFDRRIAIFDSTLKFIGAVLTNANVELNQLYNLWKETGKREFLFGHEIVEYITEVYEKGNEFMALNSPNAPNTPADLARRTELLLWFGGQSTIARDKFTKYVEFRKP